MQWDSTNGAAQYLNKEEALSDEVAVAHETHTILQVGKRGLPMKRKTAKIKTMRSWRYFLAAVRFTHVPVGCGLWPAFWTNGIGYRWPEGGELDVLEYVNDAPSRTALHTGARNQCQLDAKLLNTPGCPQFPDVNKMSYDCTTAYPKKLGCSSNSEPLQNPAELNVQPVTFVIEWTEMFVKVFKIPDHAMPADLLHESPRPREWDQWVISYYPFGRSPGCPNAADLLAPQQLILNIGLCGDWSERKTWSMSQTCADLYGPREGCLAGDCCPRFVEDIDGKYGADEYFRTRAFFNISWVKVFQQQHADMR